MKENARVTPVNKYNFVRFYPFNSTALSQSKYANEVHNGFQYRWRNIFDPLPILKGDILTIHTNFSEEVFLSGDVFRVIEGENTIVTGSTDYAITSEAISGTDNYIITLSIPSSSTKLNGSIIRIGIVAGATIKFVSNAFEVRDYVEKHIRGTHILTFEHDNDIYNYDWTQRSEAQPPYVVRVNSNLASIAYPSDDAVYKSSTTGKPRKTRSVIDKQIQFETYYASEDFHDAFNVAVHLKDFYVNGTKMIKDGSYEVSYNKIFNLSKGTINLLDTRYSIRVDRCSDLVPPEPPPADPILNYLVIELSGEEDTFIDANLRILVDSVELATAFGDNDSGTLTLSDGDSVQLQYFYLANLIDAGTVTPTLRIVVEEDGVVIVNESTVIADTTEPLTLNEFITVNAGSTYNVVVDTFDAG